jgi:Tfp pilus assembly protein PilV
MKQHRRCGFSLLEVMLATTVLLGSVIVLSHIAFVGTSHMDSAQQYAAAQLVCQTRMNEMLAGARPIEEVSRQRIRELPGWGLTVKVESTSRPGLLAIEVTAAEKRTGESAETGGDPAAASQQAVGAGKRFSLVRWIAEPEGSELSNSFSSSQTAVPVDVPMEPSFFDDSMEPGASLLPEEPMPLDESFMPDEPLLPEEPSMFDEPLPEL